MVDKDPHEFKLNFGTQSLLSDKAPASATISLTTRSSQAKPCIRSPRPHSVQVSAHSGPCIWNPVHRPPRLVTPLHHADLSSGTAASGKDVPSLRAGWVVLLTTHSY